MLAAGQGETKVMENAQPRHCVYQYLCSHSEVGSFISVCSTNQTFREKNLKKMQKGKRKDIHCFYQNACIFSVCFPPPPECVVMVVIFVF